jgi:hypothetical protein
VKTATHSSVLMPLAMTRRQLCQLESSYRCATMVLSGPWLLCWPNANIDLHTLRVFSSRAGAA